LQDPCFFPEKALVFLSASEAVNQLACIAGVNGEGEGEGEREKNGVLRARDEGTPATKTPIFFISAHRFLGNPIKLTVNATTNQKQARAFLHD